PRTRRQRLKVEPVMGVAVRVTNVPIGEVAEQAVPQSMPAGVRVTIPLPVHALTTVRANHCTSKVAVTVVDAVTVTVQASGPVQPAPLQPMKVDPLAGAAVRITTVPLS